MKKSRSISKHDIIREIRDLKYVFGQLNNAINTLGNSFRDYMEYKKEIKKFEKFLRNKYEKLDEK